MVHKGELAVEVEVGEGGLVVGQDSVDIDDEAVDLSHSLEG